MQLKGEIMDLEFSVDTDHRLVLFKTTLHYFTCRVINRRPLYSRIRPKIGKGGEIGLPKAASIVIPLNEK